MKKVTFSILFFTFVLTGISQDFKGNSGIYILGSTDTPLNSGHYNHPYVDGGVIRAKWESIEPAPGAYDFSFIDGEIATAVLVGKKVSIGVLGQPDWLVDSSGAEGYDYIDMNPNHPTYLDTLSHPVKYDPVVIQRYKLLMDELATKYANDTNISYFHIYSGVSNDLPQTVADGTPFYQAHFYDTDTLINRLQDLTNYYMNLFPNIPVWNSPDKVKFETMATGLAQNYVATNFMAWGAITYPERFGVWREDLSGCVIAAVANPTSHWAVIAQHGCRNGAQMVWNVQDGPTRMNQCQFVPQDNSVSSKVAVMDSAVKGGLGINMRYFEIYNTDLQDPDLDVVLTSLHTEIFDHVQQNCGPVTGISELENDAVTIFPNPSNGIFRIENIAGFDWAKIFNLAGQQIVSLNIWDEEFLEIDLSHQPSGLYFVALKGTNGETSFLKVIKEP